MKKIHYILDMNNSWTKYTRKWDIDHTKSPIHNTAICYIKKYENYPSIILIESPGFNDSSDPEKDKQIIDDIEATFERKLTKIVEVWFLHNLRMLD